MSGTEEEYMLTKIPEIPESNEQLKVAVKFRTYRLEAEYKDRKLKEAEIVIEQLKNELNCSRDGEKNLRSQIISGESRLICLQGALKKFITVSGQQRQNEKNSQEIERKIERLREEIEQTREKSQNLYDCVSKEVELQQKIKKLESEMILKNNECDLMKMEIQTLAKEKKTMETEFQQKLKDLERNLEKARKNETETQAHTREMLLYYKEQIEDYERKIEGYEKERKSFLEDFEPPKNLKTNSNNLAWADSTVSGNTEDRSPITLKKRDKIEMESNEPDAQAFQCSSFQIKPKQISFKKEKNSNFSKLSKKLKPQLEFLTASQDSLPKVNSVEFGRKRRLFSTNCNHYID